MRWLKTAGALLVLVLLLSSCIRYEGTITIDDDGSGAVSVLTAIDPEAFEAFGDLGDLGDFGGTDEICSDFESETTLDTEIPADATVESYTEDGFCGARVSYNLAASTNHSAALADVFDDTVELYSQGGNWFFDAGFSSDDVTGQAEDFGGDQIVEELFGDASFRITVDLPGRAVAGENNATEVGPNGLFIWDIDLLNPPTRLFAQTEPGSDGPTDESSSSDGATSEGASSEGAAGVAGSEADDDDGRGISPFVIGLIAAALIGLGALVWFLKKRNDADAASTGDFVDPGAMPQQSGSFAGAPSAVPHGSGLSGPAATLPQDGPPLSDHVMYTPVVPAPAATAVKETVMINPAAARVDAHIAPILEPVYDEEIGAWVVTDPTRGRLRHEPTTDTWIPV